MNTLNFLDRNSRVLLCVIRSSILPVKDSKIRIGGSAYIVTYVDFIVETVDSEAVLEATIVLDKL